MKYMLIGGLLMLSLSAQAGELYRWVDDKGKVHYGDERPPLTEVEKKKFNDAVPDAGLPYATRRAQQNYPVTLYVADNCVEYCKLARELLTKRGIPFAEKTLRTQVDLDAFKAASGGDKVPALAVGKTFIGGFNGERWHSELDSAGYPKIAPYRPYTAPAAEKQDATSAVAPTGTVAP